MVIKMPSSDVAADMCSSDSLSLTGLVCTQEEYLKSQPPVAPRHPRKTTKISENDINFDFSYSSPSPIGVNLHKKSESKDQQSQKSPGNVTMRDILEPQSRSKKSRSKMEVRNGNSVKKFSKEVGNKGNKEEKNGGVGQKIMQSITTPCRSCSAVEPSAVVKKPNIVQKI